MATSTGKDTVKTRILVISDTHSGAHSLQDRQYAPYPPFQAPLPKADLFIHSGDLTMTGSMSQYQHALDMIKQIDAPVKLVIAGNHDYSLDRDYMLSHIDEDDSIETITAQVNKARKLWTDPGGRAVQESVTFLDEGVHQISLPNRATVKIYASPYTPEFQGWGFPYEHDEDRFNTPGTSLSDAKNTAPYPVPSFNAVLNAPIDILITHGPPYKRLDWTKYGLDVGCPHLLRAAMRSRPLMHVFGHIHEGWGAERVTWSSNVDEITTKACSITNWKDGAWKQGIADDGKRVERLQPDLEAAKEHHCVALDVSGDSEKAIQRGQETLMVNTAIMNVAYAPCNAPWVINLDLPKGS